MSVELTQLTPPEKSRVYTFPGGELVRLEHVTHFLARESGTHRLQTGDGKLHIVPVGWLHIEIEAGAFTV
jgi:hypothetical protein